MPASGLKGVLLGLGNPLLDISAGARTRGFCALRFTAAAAAARQRARGAPDRGAPPRAQRVARARQCGARRRYCTRAGVA
jgi:hypothetical protein